MTQLCSPNGTCVLSCEASPSPGSVRVYDLPARQLLCHSRFASGGSSLLWAPLEVDPSASTLLAGFQDGVLRCGGWGREGVGGTCV